MPKENNVPLRIHFIQIICIIMFFVPMLVKKKILLKRKEKPFFMQIFVEFFLLNI